MRKGKQKASKSSRQGATHDGAGDIKAAKSSAESSVNAGVKIQDAASNLPPSDALNALHEAETKYRNSLTGLPGHAEASYNLATCLSEQADLKGELHGADAAAGEQLALLGEARALLEDVIRRDTSRRGSTTALAHHALGNVIGSVVDLHREHCSFPNPTCPLRCPGPAECMEALRESCRHFEEAMTIHNRQPNPPAGMDEVLVHWGDAELSMMHIVMEGVTTGAINPGKPSWQPPPRQLAKEALGHCSTACNKYGEALNLDTATGGSDADTLLSRAGAVVDFLDWALPESLEPGARLGPVGLGFQPLLVLSTGEHAAGVLLGLDGSNRAGLLAQGDLSRLRARTAMLAGANLQEEGHWREASVQRFAAVVERFPEDAEALASAGEGSLEYGRRGLDIYRRFAMAAQGGVVLAAPPGWNPEAMRASALARLQEAGVILSRASSSSADVMETDSIYNAACAFALCGNEASCKNALTEYFRRIIANANTTSNSRRSSRPMDSGATVLGDGSKKQGAQLVLREVGQDRDLETFWGVGWFVALMQTAESAVVSEMQPWQSKRYMGL